MNLPFRVELTEHLDLALVDSKGNRIATTAIHSVEDKKNMEYLARAANNYEPMVEMIQKAATKLGGGI